MRIPRPMAGLAQCPGPLRRVVGSKRCLERWVLEGAACRLSVS